MDNAYRVEILNNALVARVKEVTEYQVNIDNFLLAIEKIKDDPELQDFKQQLHDLLASHYIERRKAQVMLDVIRSQLE